MPSFETAFGNYLKSSDIGERKIKVTIESVEKVKLKRDDGTIQTKWKIAFVGKEKPLLLNRTNCEKIAEICQSNDVDHWINLEIGLYVDHKVRFGGKDVDAIRIADVRMNKPAPPPPPAETDFAATDEDIPF